MSDIKAKFIQMWETQREKVVLLSMLLVFMVNAVFIMLPLGNLAYKTHWYIGELKGHLDKADHDLDQEKKYMQILTEAEDVIKNNQSYVVKRELSQHLDRFAQMAVLSGIKMKALRPLQAKPEDPESENPYHLRVLELTAVGGYHAFGKFMQSLESQDNFSRVKGLSIEANAKNRSEHDIDMRIEVLQWE
jgi:Tfp pilus assembly protein PilO